MCRDHRASGTYLTPNCRATSITQLNYEAHKARMAGWLCIPNRLGQTNGLHAVDCGDNSFTQQISSIPPEVQSKQPKVTGNWRR
jgi:hypothetical protein